MCDVFLGTESFWEINISPIKIGQKLHFTTFRPTLSLIFCVRIFKFYDFFKKIYQKKINFFVKKIFFLVKIYKISDFTATVVAIWAIIRHFFFHYLKKKDFGFSITKKHWKDNYYIIIYKYTKKFFENFIFLLTKYSKIIYSCYFAILSMSFFPIKK